MKRNSFIIGLIIILLEIFVFNFSSVKSLFYDEIKVNVKDISVSGMVRSTTKDSYRLRDEETYFEIDINDKINNVYLDIEILRKNNVNISIQYTDGANGYYNNSVSEIYKHEIVKDFEKSKYVDCYYLGDTHSIKVNVLGDSDDYFNINNIILNKKVPFFINYLRMIILFILIFIPYNYFKNNQFRKLFDKNYKYILCGVIIILSIFVIILYQNISYIDISYDYYTTKYKEALMNGKFSFNVEGIDLEKFENAKNIYDYTERTQITTKGLDTTYYNGKFYMYFGILPALLMGITNLSLTNTTCLFSIIGVIFSSLFLNLLIDRYFSKTSPGLKVLLIIYFIFNSRLLLLISFTRYYELLIIAGYSLCVMGLYFLLKFYNSNKNIYLFLGSLILSLSLMCRPNMIVISIIGLYLVYKKLNKKNIAFYFMPYIVVGIILMYINYIRFGNIFEFGINYQLTIIDISYFRFNIMTLLNGIFGYLFRIPIIDGNFPYIHNSIALLPYNGFYYNKSTANGIIVMSVLGLILPFISQKTDKENKKLYLVFIVCGIILLFMNTAVGGCTKRYTIEFAWLFLIPIVLHSIKCFKGKNFVLYVLILLSCLMNFLLIFDTDKDDLKLKMNNDMYYYFKYF